MTQNSSHLYVPCLHRKVKSEILLNFSRLTYGGQTSQQIWKGDIWFFCVILLIFFSKGRSKSLHHFLFISTHFGKTLTLSTLTSSPQISSTEEAHCSKSSFFVQKFNFDFPRKLSIFWG